LNSNFVAASRSVNYDKMRKTARSQRLKNRSCCRSEGLFFPEAEENAVTRSPSVIAPVQEA
jgi:hypothetical protein